MGITFTCYDYAMYYHSVVVLVISSLLINFKMAAMQNGYSHKGAQPCGEGLSYKYDIHDMAEANAPQSVNFHTSFHCYLL